jgi:probable F420-dependent oxidoreductase
VLIGFDVRSPQAVADPQELTRLVVEGEALGFDYTTIFDHLVVQRSLQAKYDNTAETQGSATYGHCHEQLTSIAFLAAKTSRLRFATSVMVMPYRPPVLAAKMLATIDVFSGGRLLLGVGTGWIEDEFEALGTPSFAARGRVTNEYLESMKVLWTEQSASYEGDHVQFANVGFEPKPVQQPHPPIWIGGMSLPAMRRAARFGDAWYPMLNDQAKPFDSLELLRAGIDKMRAVTEEAGRNPDDLGVAVRVALHGEHLDQRAVDGHRRLFSGSSDERAGDLDTLRALGVTAVDFRFEHVTGTGVLQQMQSFQQDVMTHA